MTPNLAFALPEPLSSIYRLHISGVGTLAYCWLTTCYPEGPHKGTRTSIDSYSSHTWYVLAQE